MNQFTVNANEMIIAEAAYRLAGYTLPKDMEPTLNDIKTSIQVLIPGFSTYFGKAYEDENGQIVWPQGKKGLIGTHYDQTEELIHTILQLDTDGTELRHAATAVMMERKDGIPALVKPNDDFVMDKVMKQVVAARIVYLAGRVNSIVRKSNPMLFPTQSNMMYHNLEKLVELELHAIDADDGYTPEHEINDPDKQPISEDWSMAARDNNRSIDLQLVDYEEVRPYQKALNSWFKLGEGTDLKDYIVDELKRRAEQAREWRDAQQASFPIKGAKKINRVSA